MDDKTKLKLLDLTDQIRAILTGSLPVTPDVPVTPAAKAITSVVVQSIGGKQTDVPVTFGHVFAPGDLAADQSLDGMQIDVKALHADGSVRHAVISAIVPAIETGKDVKLDLIPIRSSKKQIPVAEKSIEASVVIILGGVRYFAYANAAPVGGEPMVWINGPVAVEVGGRAPLLDAALKEHPHLSVLFAERSYSTVSARIEVVVENDWAYEPNPQNFTYDVQVIVGGVLVYEKKNLTHYHHARWRKVFWAGKEPQVHIKHDTAYLIASRAVPNYDQSIQVSEKLLKSFEEFSSSAEPMSSGIVSTYMPMTGGRPDIGILPSWAVAYILSMDPRAARVTIAAGELAGSWPIHYRDKSTGLPISPIDFPFATATGRASDTMNPATGKYEALPGSSDGTPFTPDTPHQPSMEYLPYLLTGDYYYLEELQYWTMWSLLASHPGYRQYDKALVISDQVRGQAWTLRTLGEAAYITPDNHPLKSHFIKFIDANLNWFNENYAPGGSSYNGLGVITNGYAFSYANGTAVSGWQDDHFTSAIGHLVELGFMKAEPLLKFKSQFPIDRMTHSVACWQLAAPYAWTLRDSNSSTIYPDFAKLYAVNYPQYLGVKCGGAEFLKATGLKLNEIGGTSLDKEGQVSNMQPALAYAADISGERGIEAWLKLDSRSQKADYRMGPQFAIRPRTISPVVPVDASSPDFELVSPITAKGTWKKVASEGETVYLKESALVRYGSNDQWLYAKAKVPFVANNETFGSDPAYGVPKAAYVFEAG